MTQTNELIIAIPAKTASKPNSRAGHWVRIIVSIISFGFIFPHSFTEDDDMPK